MIETSKLYKHRFAESDLPQKNEIWKTLCRHYFSRLIPPQSSVLDLGCGYGEFINNIPAREKYGLDVNADAAALLNSDVHFLNCTADKIPLADGAVDVVFSSNFLEHLSSKADLDRVLKECSRILKPEGRFVLMGPNIKYLAAEYWDFYDHFIPLSHLSLSEALMLAGFDVEKATPKFLPYTTRSALPKANLLVALYVRTPLAWPLLGKQFLVVARKSRALAE